MSHDNELYPAVATAEDDAPQQLSEADSNMEAAESTAADSGSAPLEEALVDEAEHDPLEEALTDEGEHDPLTDMDVAYRPETQHLLEAALFSSPEPLNVERLQSLFVSDSAPLTKAQLRLELHQLQQHWQQRGVNLIEVASGWRFQIPAQFAPWMQRFHAKKPPRYSRAMLETLALIIYKQPITRGEIEAVRGVAVSTQMIKNFLDRGWIKVAGHRDVPGRPALFATTKRFLDDFNLQQLSDLPPLEEVVNLEAVEQQMKQHLQHELQLPVAHISSESVADDAVDSAVTESAVDNTQVYADTAEEVDLIHQHAEPVDEIDSMHKSAEAADDKDLIYESAEAELEMDNAQAQAETAEEVVNTQVHADTTEEVDNTQALAETELEINPVLERAASMDSMIDDNVDPCSADEEDYTKE